VNLQWKAAFFTGGCFAQPDADIFFNWYDSDSRDLKMVLDKFWENVRTKNIYYEQLISIHEKIVNHIKKLDRKKTIEELQHHFAIVLLQSLGIAQH